MRGPGSPHTAPQRPFPSAQRREDRGPPTCEEGGGPRTRAAPTLPGRAGRAASPLPAGQDDALQRVCRPAGRHLQPLHVVPEVVLGGRQGLARPRGPLEGTGGPEPGKPALPVLLHEEGWARKQDGCRAGPRRPRPAGPRAETRHRAVPRETDRRPRPLGPPPGGLTPARAATALTGGPQPCSHRVGHPVWPGTGHRAQAEDGAQRPGSWGRGLCHGL